ncbi:MAG TPA: hypothetical protein VFU02_11335 [Polyangiaceae bacterium]|nr:hypothetical protein [Polyangiaceae bacterium]
MDPWARAVSLFHDIAEFDRAAEARRQESEQASRELSEWYARSAESLLDALCVEIERRVAALGPTGLRIRVTSPSVACAPAGGAVSLRFVNVCFEEEVVTAYCTREPGHSLMLHWAWQLRRQRGRFPRILSVPGVRVRRGSREEMVLEAAGAGSSESAQARVGLADIADEILAMLAGAAASRRRLVGARRSDC